MKLGEVKVILTNLKGVAEKRFPVKVGYAISQNIEILDQESRSLERQRIKLCEMYAEKGPDGKPVSKDGNYVFSLEEQQKFQEEYLELLNEDVDFKIRTVDEKELDKCDLNDRYDIPTAEDYIVMKFMLEKGDRQ